MVCRDVCNFIKTMPVVQEHEMREDSKSDGCLHVPLFVSDAYIPLGKECFWPESSNYIKLLMELWNILHYITEPRRDQEQNTPRNS